MPKSLPAAASLEHLKNQARALQKAHRAGSTEAVDRIRAHLPRLSSASASEVLAADFPLSNAQLVVAREYGFQSWPKLKAHIEALPAPQTGAADPEERPIERREFESRLVQLCVNSRLTSFPRRRRDQLILLKSIVLTMAPDTSYSEVDVNASIGRWLASVAQSLQHDHVSMRRWLVDNGFLSRNRTGAVYTTEPSDLARAQFTPDVNEVDVRHVILAGREETARRKSEYRAMSQEAVRPHT